MDTTKAIDGILLVDKPAGWTSFDVVAKIRGQIRAEYERVAKNPRSGSRKSATLAHLIRLRRGYW